MTTTTFKEAILKDNWFDKSYYYLISFMVIGFGIFFFYTAVTNPLERSDYSPVFNYILASLLVILGCLSLYLLPKRYKVILIESAVSLQVKKDIIREISLQFPLAKQSEANDFQYFRYQRHWWTYAYNVYIFIDNDKFLVSVIGRTNTYPSSGFIDLGGTENLRKKISFAIKSALLATAGMK